MIKKLNYNKTKLIYSNNKWFKQMRKKKQKYKIRWMLKNKKFRHYNK